MSHPCAPPETDGAAYHLDHYGSCALGAGCDCLRAKWRDRACPEWRRCAVG